MYTLKVITSIVNIIMCIMFLMVCSCFDFENRKDKGASLGLSFALIVIYIVNIFAIWS